MNKITIIGNIVRDPELNTTTSGISVCNFSVAVNRNYANSEGERAVDYFNVVAWRGLGESVAKHTKKGNKVAVTGSMESRTYEDSQGVKRTVWDIVATEVEFLTAKPSTEDDKVNDELATAEDDAAGENKVASTKKSK